MGKRNDLFRKKYNELDQLCREKFKMFRNPDGSRNNLSAIYEFADTLPEKQKESLKNIVKLRNLIEHNDCAEVNYNVIEDLNLFIALAKGTYSLKNNKDFNLVSYIEHNSKSMIHAIKELELEDEDISSKDANKIENELMQYIEKLKKANTMQNAKMIVRQFYNVVNNIDNHPIFVKAEISSSRNEAIDEIYDCLNENLSDLINPFKKLKAKEIAKRYIELINKANSVERIEELKDSCCDELYNF